MLSYDWLNGLKTNVILYERTYNHLFTNDFSYYLHLHQF